MKTFFKHFCGGTSRILLASISGGMLRLYYIGAWHEPNKIILISELVLLYFLIAWGITWAIIYMNRVAKNEI